MMSEALFTGKFTNLDKKEILELFSGYDKIKVESNKNIVDFLIFMGVCSSKREARELISSNAISINGEKVNDLEYVITDKDFIDNEYIIIRKGKKNYYIGVME